MSLTLSLLVPCLIHSQRTEAALRFHFQVIRRNLCRSPPRRPAVLALPFNPRYPHSRLPNRRNRQSEYRRCLPMCRG